jgi:hypothetical protein
VGKNKGYADTAQPGHFDRPNFDSGPYSHRLAPAADINGGAEEFVFESPFQNPLYLFRGIARLAGQFLPFGAGPAIISLHPTGAPQGIPLLTESPEVQIESNQIDSEGVISGV